MGSKQFEAFLFILVTISTRCCSFECRWFWSCEKLSLGETEVTEVIHWVTSRTSTLNLGPGDDLVTLLGDNCVGQPKCLRRSCTESRYDQNSSTVPPLHSAFSESIHVHIPSWLKKWDDSPAVSKGSKPIRQLTADETNSLPVQGSVNPSEVVVMMISTPKGKYWEDRAIWAYRTWAVGLGNLIYVMEGGSDTEKFFSSRGACTTTKVEANASKFVIRKCEREPSALIAPSCTGDYYGAKGPCCKFDFAVQFMTSSAGQERFPGLKWWVFADDDVYFQLPNFLQFLSRLDNTIVQYRSPLRGPKSPHVQTGIWGHPECHKTVNSRLAQPLVLSKPALYRIADGCKLKATEQLCRVWDITHDWGCSLLFWMYQIPWGAMTGLGSSRFDDYTGTFKSLAQLRTIEDVQFVHAVSKPSKDNKFMTFDQLHKKIGGIRNHSVHFPGPKDNGWAEWEKPRPLEGYTSTDHAKQFNITQPGGFVPISPAVCCRDATEDPRSHCNRQGGSDQNATTIVGNSTLGHKPLNATRHHGTKSRPGKKGATPGVRRDGGNSKQTANTMNKNMKKLRKGWNRQPSMSKSAM